MDALDYALPLIRKWEGLRLSAYLCPAGVWTIGYGATGPNIKPGLRWTRAQADDDLLRRCRALLKDVRGLVRVPVSEAQMGALVSLAYNIGTDIDADEIAEGLGDSTLLRKLNRGDYDGASREFPKWKHAGGRTLAGLIKRRADERALFEQGSA
jgi:lysozyme